MNKEKDTKEKADKGKKNDKKTCGKEKEASKSKSKDKKTAKNKEKKEKKTSKERVVRMKTMFKSLRMLIIFSIRKKDRKQLMKIQELNIQRFLDL